MSEKKKNIHLQLKNLRIARGMTINSLAEKVGADYQQINRLERGKTNLTVDMLLKISKALNAPASKLIQEEVPEEENFLISNNRQFRKINTSLLSSIYSIIEKSMHDNDVFLSSSDCMALSTDVYNHIVDLQLTEEQYEVTLRMISHLLLNLIKRIEIISDVNIST